MAWLMRGLFGLIRETPMLLVVVSHVASEEFVADPVLDPMKTFAIGKAYLFFTAFIVSGCGRTLLDVEDVAVQGGTGGSIERAFTGGAAGAFATGGSSNSGGGSLSGDGGTGSGGSGGTVSGGSGGTGGLANSGGQSATGGASGLCQIDFDCPQVDPCLRGVCDDGVCRSTVRDQDGDGFVDALCVDADEISRADCNDLNELAHPGGVEDCTDGADNDCNGVSDCFDPACKGGQECGCVAAPAGEVCDSGEDDDCDGAVDCNDSDCQGTVVCGCSFERCTNGVDDDCDGLRDCSDPDCAGSVECSCQARPESCTNGLDDDCDGLIDCTDPQCAFSSACLCLTPESEICDDRRDNDCDGLVDCGDPDCFSSVACQACETEKCDSGHDEDCDGFLDCADPSCAFDEACPPAPEQCNNGRDDDLDGLGDCNDDDCANTPICKEKQNTCLTSKRIEPLASAVYEGDTTGQLSNFHGSCGGDAGEAVFRLELTEPTRVSLDSVGSSFDTVMYVRRGSCDFGEEIGCDDDSGGFRWSSALEFPLLQPGTYFVILDGLVVDPAGGPNEGPFVLNVEVGPEDEVCDDGRDNDGDGYADCADPECTETIGCKGCNAGADATEEFGVALCTDGLDNDCDGLSDCDDDDCMASEKHPTECCNGTDQNGNNIRDDFACRCVSNADCSLGTVCYTSTVKTCGVPCGNFFGDICPFEAPGSTCNLVTNQCEF